MIDYKINNVTKAIEFDKDIILVNGIEEAKQSIYRSLRIFTEELYLSPDEGFDIEFIQTKPLNIDLFEFHIKEILTDIINITEVTDFIITKNRRNLLFSCNCIYNFNEQNTIIELDNISIL